MIPVFIIGISRSGSKLIRDILNNHPNVSISFTEAKIIPFLIKKYNQIKLNYDDLYSIYHYIIKSTFYKKNIDNNINILGSKKDFVQEFNNLNIEYIIQEIILRSSTAYYKKSKEKIKIWGDKTPSYINYIQMIASNIKNSKFIHIIRDPRDVVLSFKKSWGKSFLGSAEKWQSTLYKYELEKHNYIDSIFEIKYEEILSAPEESVKNICDFLDVTYSDSLLNRFISTEVFGDAASATGIIKNNLQKYHEGISNKKIKTIESITYPMMKKYGYKPINSNVKHIELNTFFKILLKLYDFIMYYKHLIFREYGFIQGTIFLFKSSLLKIKENRL